MFDSSCQCPHQSTEPSRKRKSKKSKQEIGWSEEDQETSNKRLEIWIGGSSLTICTVSDPNMAEYVKSLNAQVQEYTDLMYSMLNVCTKLNL